MKTGKWYQITCVISMAVLCGFVSCKNDMTSGPKKTYKIDTMNEVKRGGIVTAHPLVAAAGTKVVLTVRPDKGYSPVSDSLKVKNGSINNVQVSAHDADGNGNKRWSFKMPSADVQVACNFTRSNNPGDPNKPADGLTTGDFVLGKGTLVWHDEFDGDSLDLTKWNYDWGDGWQYGLYGWGNDEHQWYRPENITVENGKLVIEAKNDSNKPWHYKDHPLGPWFPHPYSSGKITTGGTYTSPLQNGVEMFKPVAPKEYVGPTTKGYVEARIKMPKGIGFWPAFWLLGADHTEYSGYSKLGWPQCGEVDIMEVNGAYPNVLHQTIHYGENTEYGAPVNHYRMITKVTETVDLSEDYHVYAVSWDSASLMFYFDGQVTNTIWFPLPEGKYAHTEAFNGDKPKVIIFNLACGGGFTAWAYATSAPYTIDPFVANGTSYPGFTYPGTPPEAIADNKKKDPLFPDSWDSFIGPRENRCLMVDWVRVYE